MSSIHVRAFAESRATITYGVPQRVVSDTRGVASGSAAVPNDVVGAGWASCGNRLGMSARVHATCPVAVFTPGKAVSVLTTNTAARVRQPQMMDSARLILHRSSSDSAGAAHHRTAH